MIRIALVEDEAEVRDADSGNRDADRVCSGTPGSTAPSSR